MDKTNSLDTVVLSQATDLSEPEGSFLGIGFKEGSVCTRPFFHANGVNL